jgi:hypothetical protein
MFVSLFCAALVTASAPDEGTLTVNAAEVVTLPSVRTRRPWAVSAEAGIKSLSGVGANITYNLTPHVALDGGLGLGLAGGKVGLRGRYNFSAANLTPFIGAGATFSSGLAQDLEIINSGNAVGVRVMPTAAAQAVGGLSYVADNGLALMGSVGYSWVLRDDPVQLRSGRPTPAQAKGIEALYGHGVTLGGSIGYAF